MPKTNGRLMGGTEDMNKCQDAPWLWMRKINIIKMSICSNVITDLLPLKITMLKYYITYGSIKNSEWCSNHEQY